MTTKEYLDEMLVRYFGADAARVPSPDLTARCASCQELVRPADAESLIYTCHSCGETFNQDVNHCRNLFRIAAPSVSPESVSA